ncbi:uncharacterized protein BO80DRAFT_421246 [Aspergillus ibericus CBS 121593]|uniref:Uncharacterized protein n=1 Tax=Aspergillus ibericus CBS 121593 TaxID=1448316 RepID=A0A395HDW9_9EURO|nr:hypothetical protein BO80DRAFT_421246 [Aspergillus ibericus CBS 121593]RAL05188.1 hypothetical protein BO80DRAFT_421246 [Aspergillus ibericus CBS 121593]
MSRTVKSDKSSVKSGDSRSGFMRSMRLSSDDSGAGYANSLSDLSSGPDLQRPGTASSAWTGRDSYASSVCEKQDYTEGSSVGGSRSGDVPSVNPKYEMESGLQWNRIVPALSLLQNASHEAQQRRCDARLARLLYINALGYLLDGLPADMTDDEIRTIRRNLPAEVRETLPARVQGPFATGLQRLLAEDRYPPYPPERSYIHRLLALSIVYFFLLLQFFMPHIKVLVRFLYQYERTHRVTERAITTAKDAVDTLGRRGVHLGSAILNSQEGRVGANVAAWWVEGIAGGLYEGLGEGMIIMGLTRPHAEMGRASMQAQR